jgi:Flp pilus assembly protein TadD
MNAQELFEKAQMLFLEGRGKESIDAFTRAIDAGADPFIIYLSRGAAHLKFKEIQYAIHDFTRAIAVNENSDRPYYYRGVATMINEDFTQAAEDFTKALELKPNHFQAKFARAVCYARMGKFDEATNDLRAVIPQMETGLQSFVDTYGIVRTEMWKVMAQLSGERETPTLELTKEEIETLKEWVQQD